MSEKFILKSKKTSFEIPVKSVGEVVYERLQKLNGEMTCIIETKTGKKITLKELISQANSVAAALIKRGITKEDKILIFSPNSIQSSVLLLASYFLGLTLVPFVPTIASHELEKEIQSLGSIIIFTSVENTKNVNKIIENKEKFPKLNIKSVFVLNGTLHWWKWTKTYLNFEKFENLLIEGKNEIVNKIPYFSVDPKKDIFLLVRSPSGTDSLQKTVIISHYSFVASLTEFCKTKQFEKVITPIISSFGEISANLSFANYLCLGATLVLYEEYDDELLLQSVEKYRINVLVLFPAIGQKLIEGNLSNKYNLSSVRMMFTETVAFPPNVAKELVKKYKVIFREIYGMAEFMPITEYPNIENTEFIPASAGHVSQMTELKIVDISNGQTLGPNNKGKICIRGPKMFSGYLNDVEAMKKNIDGDGWFHTADVGYYDLNERIFISDSIKDVIKFRNWPVFPAEIEQFLITHESVAEAVVIGIKHEIENEWPRAYVRLKEGKKATEEELKKYVSDKLLGYVKELRAGIVFVDLIPKSRVGKINRKYFKQLASNEVLKSL